MSCSRENVTWQSADGTWNCGHFAFYAVNQDDPDWDYEWDVEYEWDRFHAVTVGHPSEEAAYQAWSKAGHSNPGGGTHSNAAPDSDEVKRYEAMAARVKTEGRFDRGWYRT